MKYTLKDIKSVEFILENCESMIIPKECFDNFEIKEYDDFTYEYELKCKIISQDNIIYNDFGWSKHSPIDRLLRYNDIVRCRLILENTLEQEFNLVWHDSYKENNVYQQANKVDYKTLELMVKVKNYNDHMKSKQGEKVLDLLLDFPETGCNDCWNKHICTELKSINDIKICDVLSLITK